MFFWPAYKVAGADLAFFQGGGGGFDPTTNFFVFLLLLFWTPVSDVFLASTKGGGGFKPYCLRLSLRQSAIGTYWVGLDIMMAFFYAHYILIFYLAAQGGEGV